MKSYKYRYIFLAIIVMSLTFCTKKLIPGGSAENNKEKYDSAAFNYVYVEALKQKLLGNGGDALKYLEQCIKINPESDAAYYQMAQIVIANGDIKDGKHYRYKSVINRSGKHMVSHNACRIVLSGKES
jgi:tetratricopeptide (TPR) repeat protein